MVFDKTRNYLFSAGVAEHHASFSKKELSQLILQKDSIIAKLRNELKLQADTTAYNISYIDVKNDALNMRRSANLASEVIMKIPHRSAVKVVERSERLQVLDGSTGYWIKIEYDGNVGWVWGNYLSNSLPQ